MINKRKIYVILLLLLIIFVSLSFYYILYHRRFESIPADQIELLNGVNVSHFEMNYTDSTHSFWNQLQEGLCLPSCSKVEFDSTSSEIPECSALKINLLQPRDASIIEEKIIKPFIKKINNEMINNYDYKMIKSLYSNYKYNVKIKCLTDVQQGQSRGVAYGENQELLEKQKQEEQQKQMNSYFTDFSYNVTYQDVMDNFVIKIEEIKNNCIFRNHPEKENIISSVQQYKNDRTTELKEIYEKFLKDIEPYGENIVINDECENDENKNLYKDENFKQIIKDQKENIVYYSEKSTFHIIYNYIKEGKEGKLGKI